MANIASVRRAGASGPSPADPHDKETRREPFSNGLACCRTDRWRTLAGAFARLSVQSLTISSRGTDMGGGGGGGIDGPCLPVRLPACPRDERLTKNRTRRLFDALIGLSFKAIQSKISRLLFFLQCYPFLIKPSFCYPRFVSFRLQVTFFRPPLHAPQYTPQQPPPFAYPCPSTLPFLWMGHELSGEPTLRRICPRIRAKRSHPQPCPDAKTNALLCVLRQPP